MLLCLSPGTDRCDVETSILRSLGLHFDTLGEHFGLILQLLGLPWGPLGAFWRFPHESLPRFGYLFGTGNLKSREKAKKTVSRKQCRTNVIPGAA